MVKTWPLEVSGSIAIDSVRSRFHPFVVFFFARDEKLFTEETDNKEKEKCMC